MIMTSVESSNVSKLGWEGGDLFVQFKRGHVYRYKEVPMHVFNDAVEAPSVGKFLIANVFNSYPYAQIEGGVEGLTRP